MTNLSHAIRFQAEYQFDTNAFEDCPVQRLAWLSRHYPLIAPPCLVEARPAPAA